MGEHRTKREQFTFYRSYYEALKALPKREQVSVVLAICAYALDEEVPSLSGVALSVFTLIKPTLDSGRNKAMNRRGKSAERAEQQSNNSGTNEEQNENKQEQTRKEKEGEGEKEREVEGEGEGENDSSLPPAPLPGGLAPTAQEEQGPKGARAGFIPPTLEEVTAYVLERGSPVDPQAFIDFYAAKGWRIGTSPMKDWRAACRNAESWERWSRAQKTAATGKDGVAWMRDYIRERGDGL